MRLLVVLMLVAAALPLAAPVASACHPNLYLETPTSPSVGVAYSVSCDHKYNAVCIYLDGVDLLCVSSRLP